MKSFKKQQFMDWCVKNNITQFQAFSIAFVEESTAKDIFYTDRERVAGRFRLWQLTGLDCFKLTNEELNEYAVEKKRRIAIQQDEQLMYYFRKQWLVQNLLPAPEDSLSLRSEVKQNKKELRRVLMEKFFGQKPIAAKSQNPKSSSVAIVPVKVLNNPDTGSTSTLGDKLELDPIILKLFNTAVHHKVHTSTKDELLVFKKQNLPAIKEALGLLNILMEEDPFAAAKEVRNFNQFLKH